MRLHPSGEDVICGSRKPAEGRSEAPGASIVAWIPASGGM